MSYKEEVKRLTKKMNSPVRGVGKFSLSKSKKPMTTVNGSVDAGWVTKNSIQGKSSYTEKSLLIPTISVDVADYSLQEAKEQVVELQSENGRLKSLLERLRQEMKDNLDNQRDANAESKRLKQNFEKQVQENQQLRADLDSLLRSNKAKP